MPVLAAAAEQYAAGLPQDYIELQLRRQCEDAEAFGAGTAAQPKLKSEAAPRRQKTTSLSFVHLQLSRSYVLSATKRSCDSSNVSWTAV